MATFYAAETAALGETPPGKVLNQHLDTISFPAVVTLAAQTTSDTIVLAKVPAGYRFLRGNITSSVSLGTSTVAIGISGSTGKYRTAAVFTATDTPTAFGNAAAVGAKLTAEETIFITIGTASLPASGRLVVDLVFATA